MDAATWHGLRTTTMWTLHGISTEERQAPRHHWWLDNRPRQPLGAVVVQIVTRGRIILRQPDGDREVIAGQAVLFAYGEPTAYGRPPGWAGARDEVISDWASLTGAGLREHWDLLRARAGAIVPVSGRDPLHDELRLLARADPARLRADPPAMAVRVAALVATLTRTVEAAAGAERSPVEVAIERILADPCADHPMKALATRSGCSREHLARAFALRVGEPPAAWLRRQRLARAAELLGATELPIAAVAAQCGAGTAHRLARWTAAAHGCAPLALRHRLRGGR